MVLSCVVVGCVNCFKSGSGLKFHRIPKEFVQRSKWLQAINRKNWTPDHNGDRVCGDHFLSGSAKNDPTDPDFIPHINMGYEKKDLATPESKQARFQRVNRRNEDKSKRNKELIDRKDAACALMEMSTVTNRSGHLTDSLESQGSLGHVDDKDNETRADIHNLCLKKIASLQREKRQLLDKLSVLQDELRETGNKLVNVKFGDAFLAGGTKLYFTLVSQHMLLFCGWCSFATLFCQHP